MVITHIEGMGLTVQLSNPVQLAGNLGAVFQLLQGLCGIQINFKPGYFSHSKILGQIA